MRRLAPVLMAGLALVVACSSNGSGDGHNGGAGVIEDTGGELSEDLDLPTVPPADDGPIIVTTTVRPTTLPPTTTPSTTAPVIDTVVIPDEVLNFAPKRSDLSDQAKAKLRGIADDLRRSHPNARMTFVGHTDSRGLPDVNMQLSIDRAKAVYEWFGSNGFDRSRLSFEGRGESQLLVPDYAGGVFIEEAGARNRRVVIEIVDNP